MLIALHLTIVIHNESAKYPYLVVKDVNFRRDQFSEIFERTESDVLEKKMLKVLVCIPTISFETKTH